ncbi:putative Leucine Rich repeat (2 copies) [Leishmania utingensis]|uniref:Leucine Rich repeat (2 copies) n=1 Tax=Leishmania utingensis TaxID=653362 RepID=A0AAW3AU57_9TRYP
MSIPHLTAEEMAYYASLSLADPDEAELAAFLAGTQQEHEGHPRETGAASSSTAPSAGKNGSTLIMSRCAPTCERFDSSDVEGLPPRCAVVPVNRWQSSTFASTTLARWLSSAGLFPEPKPATPDNSTRYGITQVLEKDNLVGGVAGIADAALQTRYVDLPARQLTSVASIQCFLNATHVYLQHNALTSLEGVELLSQLRVLVVHHNQLTSLAPLQQLDNLFYLDVSHNNLSSSVDVLLRNELPCLCLKSLNLSDNPCWYRCGGRASDVDGGKQPRAYVQQMCAACPLLERLDDVDIDDGEEVVQHSDSSTESDVSDALVRQSTGALPSRPRSIAIRRVHDAVEAARAASLRASVPHMHPCHSPASSDSLSSSGGAELSIRSQSAGKASKAALLEEEQARLVHQLMLRRAADAAPESLKVVDTLSTSPPHFNRSTAGNEHSQPGAATTEAPAELKVTPPAYSTADVSEFYGARSDTLQLYRNLQFTQEVSQARLLRDLAAHWDDVSRVLQTAQALQQDRRRRLQQRLQAHTPAYTESLTLLEKESHAKDLDHYRNSGVHRKGTPTSIHVVTGAPVAPPAAAGANISPAVDGKWAPSTSFTSTHPLGKTEGNSKKCSSASEHVPKPPPRR